MTKDEFSGIKDNGVWPVSPTPFLTVDQMRMLLRYVTYKPGWSFDIYEGRHEGPHIQITTQVEDSYNPGQTVTLDVHAFISPVYTSEQFYDWLLWRIKRIECHEAREFFKVAGVVFSDPHGEFADRDL